MYKKTTIRLLAQTMQTRRQKDDDTIQVLEENSPELYIQQSYLSNMKAK